MTTEYTKNFGLALPDFRTGPWHDLLNSDLTKIDQVLYGALSQSDTTVWVNDHEYTVGQTVVDPDDSTTWMCNVDHTSPVSGSFIDYRTAHPTHWIQLLAGFAPRGEWDNDTNYYPYDLAYQSNVGVFALCQTRHVSNSSGDIRDDEAYWWFIFDMSGTDLSTAVAVSYDSTNSHLGVTDVQAAIDKLETQVVALNNVNITQGNQITTLQGVDTTHETRMGHIEDTNTAQAASLSDLDSRITALQAQVNAIPTSTFPIGTRLFFPNANPPTGWTKLTGFDNSAIRVVDGLSGGTTGGSQAFTAVFGTTSTASFTLTMTHIPNHAHNVSDRYVKDNYPGGPGPFAVNLWNGIDGHPIDIAAVLNTTTDAQGSSQPHAHAINLQVKYVDTCLGQKS